MYYDRWVLGNQRYDRARFRELALDIAVDFRQAASKYETLFLNYLNAGRANTSEPAIESRAFGGVHYKIYRPLLLASEQECAEFAGRLGVTLESSGCGHTHSMGVRTAREIVQYEMLPKILGLGGARQVDEMARHVIDALQDGHINADVRRSRGVLLGRDYKASRAGLGDKL